MKVLTVTNIPKIVLIWKIKLFAPFDRDILSRLRKVPLQLKEIQLKVQSLLGKTFLVHS